MPKKWLLILNLCLIGLGLLFMFLAGWTILNRPKEIPLADFSKKTRPFPKLAFAQSKEAYNAIGDSLLTLAFAPPSMKLPDLKGILNYYGPNGRPDVVQEKTALHFSMADGKSQATIAPHQKLYLLYDRTQLPNRYIFSPTNAETALWITAEPKGSEAIIDVFMRDEKNEIVRNPASLAQIKLPQKEFIRSATNTNWEIGKWKVDGTLLGRQRARWYGMDKFLEKHGGDEYANTLNKQRIDFGEGDELYSVYVGLNDILIWDGTRWKEVEAGPDSIGHPLIQVKKIDERLMNLDLWDNDGKNKINLTLLKSSEPWQPQRIEQEFKFVAARTRSQYIFEVQKERMLIKPQDWLLLTEAGWKILSTEQEIQDYVNRKTRGTLFIFDGISKKEDRQVLQGTLFNPSRSEIQTVELTLPQANVNVISVPQAVPTQLPPQNPSSLPSPPSPSSLPPPPPAYPQVADNLKNYKIKSR